MTTHTIPGELFLLLTNDAGRQDATTSRRQALAAAAIAELVLRERVALGEERNPRVHVLSTEPTDLPVLDQALGAVSDQEGKPLTRVIAHRSMDLTEVIGEGFAAVGEVRRHDGWFATTWPAQTSTLERALRSRLGAALTTPAAASLQDGILLQLLRALGIAHRILQRDLPGWGRREIEHRIAALDIDDPAAVAVKRLLADTNVAMMAAVVGGAVAGSS